MLSEKDLLDALLEAAPKFRPDWEAFLAGWGGKEPGYYNSVAEFAHYLVKSYEAGETESFPATFQQVEHLLREGNSQVKNILAAGLIEDIQNIASHRPFGATVFIPWLGPESLRVWKAIDEGMKKVAAWVAEHPSNTSVDIEEALSKVENPKLRAIMESMSRRENQA